MGEVYEYTIEWMPQIEPIKLDEILLRKRNDVLNERGEKGWKPVYFHPKPIKITGIGITYPIILQRKKR